MKNWKHVKFIQILIDYDFAEEACWVWPLGKVAKGYGVLWEPNFGGKGKPYYVHRTSLELWGKAPKGFGHTHARHKCSNTACFNPEHLVWGTHQDNMLDKRKGLLQGYGITPYALLMIKQTAQLSERSVAKAYRIPRSLVHKIRQGYYDDV